jgi:hypothetical protein
MRGKNGESGCLASMREVVERGESLLWEMDEIENDSECRARSSGKEKPRDDGNLRQPWPSI